MNPMNQNGGQTCLNHRQKSWRENVIKTSLYVIYLEKYKDKVIR